ncbi:FHA domain-containing protein [Microseira sp. BLCC-F43]|uniref:FHA domain-containing protein n=1 Tax=Microseira sp. BLCC-F43 TaxID=3153602 RepID=UPI0035BAFAD9
MIDPHSTTALISSLLESSQDMELENRLGLYQVFLKLYHHHRSLLDDILRLENVGNPSVRGTAPAYVQAGIHHGRPYLITNLLDGKTQGLFQPEGVWILGRDRRANIPILEQCMSRVHAAIQYVPNQGYYLIDLGSTNGSFVNSEPVFERQLLKDGDQIRLGSVAISFFSCQTTQTLRATPPEILAKIQAMAASDANVTPPLPGEKSKDTDSLPPLNSLKEEPPSESSLSQLSSSVQSEILDRFFSQQMPAERN